MSISFKLLLAIALMHLTTAFANAGILAEHPGFWLGELKLPDGRRLKIGAEIYQRADGTTWASFASPDQNAYDIPVKNIVEDGHTLELDLSFASMKMSWNNDHFDAVYRQHDDAILLKLFPVAAFPIQLRPQTPVAPFPYRDEAVTVTSKDGAMLSATLSVPLNNAQPSVAILLHGSGPINRDAAGEGHQTFAVLADYLARQGIAVLRYDKRGIARSTGDYAQHTSEQLADDAEAVLLALKARQQFNKIGFVGHSEGPGIAAKVAQRQPESVDFIVSLAGVGLPGVEMLLLQDAATAKVNGASEQEVFQLVEYARQFYQIIIDEPQIELRLKALNKLELHRPEAERVMAHKYQMDRGTLSLAWADKPFLRQLLTENIQLAWQAVKCPVLAVNGELDSQVPPGNLDGITAALHRGGNQRITAVRIASLNHNLQTAITGAEAEYSQIEETIAPAVLHHVATFINGGR